MLGLFRKKRPAEPRRVTERDLQSLKSTIISNVARASVEIRSLKQHWPQHPAFDIALTTELVALLTSVLVWHTTRYGSAALHDALMATRFPHETANAAYWAMTNTSKASPEGVRAAEEVRLHVMEMAALAGIQYLGCKFFSALENPTEVVRLLGERNNDDDALTVAAAKLTGDPSDPRALDILHAVSVYGVFIDRVMAHTGLDQYENPELTVALRGHLYTVAAGVLGRAKLHDKVRKLSR